MTKCFDVFLSHNSKDKPAVRELAEALRARGLRIWLDEWELVPGRPWQEALEAVIETTQSAAVLVGKDGLGPWQNKEMRGCLSEFVDRNLPVIPVLLPSAPEVPRLPIFLKGFTWVDLRGGLTEEGLDRLQWGITGKKPNQSKPPSNLPPEVVMPAAMDKEQPQQKVRALWGISAWIGLFLLLGIAVFLFDRYRTGESPSRIAVPERAARADSWRDFVLAVRSWEPVVERPGNEGRGGMVAPGASGGEELVTAAQTFKQCVSELEEDPLAAWQQLVRGVDGTSLAHFHAFSSNLRLRGNSSATRMIAVENLGAQLLAREIHPRFEIRLRGLWTIAGSCCNGRFPFISRARLQGHQESYQRGPSAGGPWAPSGRDSQARSVTDVLELDTVSLDALDLLFFSGGNLDSLFEEFAIDPILDSREKAIDFVGVNKERLRALRQWQRFIYGDGRTSAAQKFQVKLLSGASTAPRIFIGERMGQIELFGPRNAVRPSTDAGRERALPMPLVPDDRTVSLVGRNEEKAGGWSGILTLRGGPLKVPYFVHLASQGKPREGGRVWTMLIQFPDYTQPRQRLEGVFEITFERPLPELVPIL